MGETRDATLQLLTPLGRPALGPLFGIRPQQIVVELGADGVWSNFHTVDVSVWAADELRSTEHLQFCFEPGKSLRVEVSGFELTIDGFEPMVGSLNTAKVIYWEDTLRFLPEQITVVAESLHEVSAA